MALSNSFMGDPSTPVPSKECIGSYQIKALSLEQCESSTLETKSIDSSRTMFGALCFWLFDAL